MYHADIVLKQTNEYHADIVLKQIHVDSLMT